MPETSCYLWWQAANTSFTSTNQSGGYFCKVDNLHFQYVQGEGDLFKQSFDYPDSTSALPHSGAAMCYWQAETSSVICLNNVPCGSSYSKSDLDSMAGGSCSCIGSPSSQCQSTSH